MPGPWWIKTSWIGCVDIERHPRDVCLYTGQADSLTSDDVNPGRIGRRLVLSSSYTGGDSYMQQRYQNTLGSNRHLTEPTLFIANP